MLENFFVSVNILKSSKLLPNGEERNNLKIWKRYGRTFCSTFGTFFIVAKVLEKNIKSFKTFCISFWNNLESSKQLGMLQNFCICSKRFLLNICFGTISSCEHFVLFL